MRLKYAAPRAEKLVFDYTNVVVASGHGDKGQGHGCKGAPIPGQEKAHGNGNSACQSGRHKKYGM